MTFRFWSERDIPPQHLQLFDGAATLIGSASQSPKNPFSQLSGAHAIIASIQYEYSGTVMDQSPELCVISRTGIGYDTISIPDATERGIVVCNAPDAPTISTAELTVTLMLAVAKKLKSVEKCFHQGENTDYFNTYTGIELYGLQLGIIGLGRIGSRVAQLAQAFGMKIVGFDPFISVERAEALNAQLLPTLESVLTSSDIVSLHVPHTDKTHRLMNAERLAQMKPGAILINAARGDLVDETALLDTLNQGHLYGAALDVLQQEPIHLDVTHPLLNRDDVVVTPHIASATLVGKARLWEMAITQALQVLRGERPANMVNPEVWAKRKLPMEIS